MWLVDPQSVLLKVLAYLPFLSKFWASGKLGEWLCSLMATSEVQSKKCFTLYINRNKGKNWDLQLFPEHFLCQTLDIVRRNGRSTHKSLLHINLRQVSSHLFPRGTTVQRYFTTIIKSPRSWVQGKSWHVSSMGWDCHQVITQVHRKRFIGTSPEKSSLLRGNSPHGQSRVLWMLVTSKYWHLKEDLVPICCCKSTLMGLFPS